MLQSEIARYLDAQGILNFDETGLTGNTFIDILPAEPDEAIAIYRRSGTQSDSKLPYDNAGIQFIVRGKYDPRVPLQLAQDIYDELHGFSSDRFEDGGKWIVGCIGTQSGPVRLGQDENGRAEYSLNFNVDYQNKTKQRSEY